jgi:hypothetical protein
MRIVDKKEFLGLPVGTVYSRYASLGDTSGLYIKDKSHDGNWSFRDLIDCVEAEDSEEIFDIYAKAESLSSFVFRGDPECLHRDGAFSDSDRFVVWDKQDLERFLTSLLRHAIAYEGLTVNLLTLIDMQAITENARLMIVADGTYHSLSRERSQSNTLAPNIKSNMIFESSGSTWHPTERGYMEKGMILIWCVNEDGIEESFAPAFIARKNHEYSLKSGDR